MNIRNFDIDGQMTDLSAINEVLYQFYHYQALWFESESLKQISDILPQLFPTENFEGLEKMRQLVNLQLLMKFSHCAETVGAVSLSFLTTYESPKDEIVRCIKKLCAYNAGMIKDFYSHIRDRDLSYIGKFLGYPAAGLQDLNVQAVFDSYSSTIKSLLEEIGYFYLQLIDLYNAYKHGYRLATGYVNNSIDCYSYLNVDGAGKILEINFTDVKEIKFLTKQCVEIIDCIFSNHHTRINHELKSPKAPVKERIDLKGIIKKNISPPKPSNTKFVYPNRIDRVRAEEEECEKVYAQFKKTLEIADVGKIVAIDIDNKCIIGMDYDITKVMEIANNYDKSGRKYIRRIGKDKRVNVTIY